MRCDVPHVGGDSEEPQVEGGGGVDIFLLLLREIRKTKPKQKSAYIFRLLRQADGIFSIFPTVFNIALTISRAAITSSCLPAFSPPQKPRPKNSDKITKCLDKTQNYAILYL